MSQNTIKNMQTNHNTVYAGIDVAKATLQLHLQGHQTEFGNQAAGLDQLCKKLQSVPYVQVVCEATGGYERALVRALQQARFRSVSPIPLKCEPQRERKVNALKPIELTRPC